MRATHRAVDSIPWRGPARHVALPNGLRLSCGAKRE
jgi:hypothetical protein